MTLNLNILSAGFLMFTPVADKPYCGVTPCIYLSAFSKGVCVEILITC